MACNCPKKRGCTETGGAHAGLSSGGDDGASNSLRATGAVAGCGGTKFLPDPAGKGLGVGTAPKSESKPSGSPSVGAPNIAARSGAEAGAATCH